jgi:hypothetical protein
MRHVRKSNRARVRRFGNAIKSVIGNATGNIGVKTTHRGFRPAAMQKSAAAIVAFAVAAAMPFMAAILAKAAPAQFVQLCSGTSFLIPGTNNCVDADQITENQFAVARQASTAFTGIAMASALAEPFVPDKANYAIAIHEATFEDKFAMGLAGLMRLEGNLMLSAGIAVGHDTGFVVLSQKMNTAIGIQSPVSKLGPVLRSWQTGPDLFVVKLKT